MKYFNEENNFFWGNLNDLIKIYHLDKKYRELLE